MKGEKVYIIHRFNKCYSSLYLDLAEGFGQRGGFDAIIDRAKDISSIETLFEYIEFIAAANQLYHRTYVRKKITPFVEAAMRYMSNIPEEQLRFVKKERLDLALSKIEDLMRRVYTAKTKGELHIKLRIGVSISLMRSEQLERRIHAIRLIAETCKSAKASQEVCVQTNLPTANDSVVLSSLLQVPQIIEEIFGKRSHIQLIQRSTEILKFVLLYSKITKSDFNVIWDCCEHDEQSKVEIFKVISDSSNLLPSELMELIVEKFMAMPRTAYKNQDAEMVCDLCGPSVRPVQDILLHLLELLWQVIKGDIPNISNEIVDKAMGRFCDVITTPTRVPEATMQSYFSQCYAMLEKVSPTPNHRLREPLPCSR